MSHIDIFLKELRILLNEDLFLGIFLDNRDCNHLIERPCNIDFDNRILDECRLVITKGDEDGLLIDRLCLQPQRELICPMQDVLIEKVEVGIVPQGSVHQSCSIYIHIKRYI